jgi:hypothetical protein
MRVGHLAYAFPSLAAIGAASFCAIAAAGASGSLLAAIALAAFSTAALARTSRAFLGAIALAALRTTAFARAISRRFAAVAFATFCAAAFARTRRAFAGAIACATLGTATLARTRGLGGSVGRRIGRGDCRCRPTNEQHGKQDGKTDLSDLKSRHCNFLYEIVGV